MHAKIASSRSAYFRALGVFEPPGKGPEKVLNYCLRALDAMQTSCATCPTRGCAGKGYAERHHMRNFQNYGPFLGPYYNTGPSTGPNLGDPKKGTIMLTIPHMLMQVMPEFFEVPLRIVSRSSHNQGKGRMSS